MNNESEEKETQLNSSKRKTKIGLPAYIVSLLLVALIVIVGRILLQSNLMKMLLANQLLIVEQKLNRNLLNYKRFINS